jgi:hypothetical protein
MFITWEEAKQKYPNNWVVFKDPQYNDKFHMDFIGGEFVGIADDMDSMEALMPDLDDGHTYTPRHTREDEAIGLLKSGF